MARGQMNNRLVLECKFGKLVCEVVRDDDEYKEFAIDLYRNDGKAVQVCVVGTCENPYAWQDLLSEEMNEEIAEYNAKVHVALWDGADQDSCMVHYVEPYGDGWWGEDEA